MRGWSPRGRAEKSGGGSSMSDTIPPGAHGFRVSRRGPADGNEPFSGTDLRLGDFWRWAFSDLVSNVTRSTLAEFLVATAVGDSRPVREEWADFDVLTPAGVRVEVKSSAYLQTWFQRQSS